MLKGLVCNVFLLIKPHCPNAWWAGKYQSVNCLLFTVLLFYAGLTYLIFSVWQWHWLRCPLTAAWVSTTKPSKKLLLQTTVDRPVDRAARLMPPCKFRWCEMVEVNWDSIYTKKQPLILFRWSNSHHNDLVLLQSCDQTWYQTLRACWWTMGPWSSEACGKPEEILQE